MDEDTKSVMIKVDNFLNSRGIVDDDAKIGFLTKMQTCYTMASCSEQPIEAYLESLEDIEDDYQDDLDEFDEFDDYQDELDEPVTAVAMHPTPDQRRVQPAQPAPRPRGRPPTPANIPITNGQAAQAPPVQQQPQQRAMPPPPVQQPRAPPPVQQQPPQGAPQQAPPVQAPQGPPVAQKKPKIAIKRPLIHTPQEKIDKGDF
jgi:hypothetical protein